MRLTSHPIVAVGLAIVFSGAGGSTTAQPGVKPNWLRMDTVRVKPEAWTEYRGIERDEILPALRKAGIPYRAAWVTAEFGHAYQLTLVQPMADFGMYDTGDSFTRSLAPREAERLRERVRRCVLSRETGALLQRADLSVSEAGKPFALVSTVSVAFGRDHDYETFLRGTLPAIRKAGIAYGVYQRVYGPTAWLLVQNLDSLNQLGQPTPGLFRAYGAEGAERRIGELTGVVTGMDRQVLRFDPELSFSSTPAPPAAR
jgi:hypothetical protein